MVQGEVVPGTVYIKIPRERYQYHPISRPFDLPYMAVCMAREMICSTTWMFPVLVLVLDPAFFYIYLPPKVPCAYPLIPWTETPTT